MKPRLLLQLLLLLLSVAGLYGQSEHARDDEFLIRGLMRDGLTSVAADVMLTFVEKYPDYPKNNELLGSIADEIYREEKYSRLYQLARAWFQLPRNENRNNAEMAFYRAVSAYYTEREWEASTLLPDVIGQSSLSRSRRLLAARLYIQILAGENNYRLAADMRARFGFLADDEQISLIFAELQYTIGERDEAIAILQRLAARGSENVQTAAAVSLAQKYLARQEYEEVLKTLAGRKAESQQLENSIRHLRFTALLSLGRHEEAYQIFAGELPEPKQQRTLLATFKALGETEQLAEMTENEYLMTTDPKKKRYLSEQLSAYYRQLGDRRRLLEFQEQQLQRAKGKRRMELLLSMAELTFEPDEKASRLEQALGSARSQNRQTDIRLQLVQLYRRLGRWQDARDTAALLLQSELTPELEWKVRSAHADLLRQQGEYQAALAELRAVFGDTRFSSSLRLQATEAALEIYRRLDQKTAIIALVASEPSGRLLESLSDRSLQIVFTAATALGENKTAARCGEHLFLRDALQPAEQLAWARNVLVSDWEFGRAILEQLVVSGSEETAYSAARTLAAELEQKGLYSELASLGERLAEEHAGTHLAHLGRLFEARAARARNDAAAFRSIVSTFLRNHTDSPLAGELRDLFIAVSLEGGNTMTALSADDGFKEIEPVSVWRADASLNRARSLFHFGDFAAVAEIYQAYPRAEQLSDKHRYMYAVSLNRLGQVTQAGRVMTGVDETALYPHWRWPLLEVLADAAFASQQWQQALELYQRIHESHAPEALREQILFPMAEAAERCGEWRVAAIYYKSFISENREALTVELLQQLAGRFTENEDYDYAISILRTVAMRLEDSQAKADVAFQIARLVYRHRGAEAGAEELLKVAYEYSGDDEIASKARLQAAETYLKAEMLELAVRQLKIVAERYPRLPAGREAAARLVQLSGINQTIEEEVLQ